MKKKTKFVDTLPLDICEPSAEPRAVQSTVTSEESSEASNEVATRKKRSLPPWGCNSNNCNIAFSVTYLRPMTKFLDFMNQK